MSTLGYLFPKDQEIVLVIKKNVILWCKYFPDNHVNNYVQIINLDTFSPTQ